MDFTFTWCDYTLFSLILGSSALIGIYFGCFGKKQTTAKEYLLGGKEMSVFPIASSLIASNVSGITMLAVPSDVYRYGATIWLNCLSLQLALIIAIFVTLPVLYKLQLTSVYEYLNLRFNSSVRMMSSLLFAISTFLYLPIVIYIPALALSQATGISIHIIASLVCGVCIFYTTLGGLKAVVWTDTLQFIVMVGAIIAVTIIGTMSVGGFENIWETSVSGERLFLDFDVDPTKRDTVWTVSLGVFFTWMQFTCVSPGVVQKSLALPTIQKVYKAYFIFGMGMLLVTSTSVYMGLIMYTKYLDCDPIQDGRVLKPDQLLPYFIMDVAGKIPGLPGIFIAGVFSASLSSLSASMNCLSGTIYEDFLSHHMPENISQKTVSNILKGLVVIIGVICTALVFVVEKLGSVMALAYSVSGVTAGPILGLFLFGMLFRSANSKGALYGTLSSLLVMAWTIFGTQWQYIEETMKPFSTKPLSVEGCTNNSTALFDITSSMETASQLEGELDNPFFLYQLSFYYYTLLGTVLVFVVGLPVSWYTKDESIHVPSDLLSPVINRWSSTQKLSPIALIEFNAVKKTLLK